MTKKKIWNVLLVPEGGGKVRSIRIPHRVLHGAVGAAILGVLLVAGAAGIGLWALNGMRAAQELRKENASLRSHLNQVDQTLEQVKGIVRDGREMERQARILAGVGSQPGKLKPGVGGPLILDTDGGAALSHPVPSAPGADLPADLRETLQSQSIRLDSLRNEVVRQRASMEETAGLLRLLGDRMEHTPAASPLRGTYAITGVFGHRLDPFTGEAAFHAGVDLRADEGTPVQVTAAGTVTSVGLDGPSGLCIRVDHGYGYRTAYCHLSAVTVHAGQVVERGTVIGTVGTTGRSTGPHLHYEVYVNAVARDPSDYLR